jgi:hypothetical protein
MDMKIHLDKLKELGDDATLDFMKFQKMIFLYNALENGWSIKKRKDKYVFSKNHEGKKEIFDEAYLSLFMKQNMNINNILV